MEAIVVVDLGYGDAGKGATVDYLVRKYGASAVVRFNGGPQAGHNVVLPDGRHHTFSTWGAGTLAGAETYLTSRVLVNPYNAFREATHLEELGVEDPFKLLHVDPGCAIITPWHVAENRVREHARGDRRHGSVGEGIGATMADKLSNHVLTMYDLYGLGLRERLREIRDRKYRALLAEFGDGPWMRWWPPLYTDNVTMVYKTFARRLLGSQRELPSDGTVIFEGAQGVLIDEKHGYEPYRTWSNCTFGNAIEALEGRPAHITRLGVTRTYMVRHGAGPLPASAARVEFSEPHNVDGEWQGSVRYGYADMPALRYAIRCCGGIDGLVLTHCDVGLIDGQWVQAYEGGVPVFGKSNGEHPSEIFAEQLGVDVVMKSWGPTHEQRADGLFVIS